MHSNIQDADEGTLYNLQLETRAHVFSSVQLLGAAYLGRGHGFQTWETSLEYAIRRYACILIASHLVSAKIPRFLFGDQKVRLQTSAD